MEFEKLLDLIGEVSDEVKEEIKSAFDARYEQGKNDQIAEQEKSALSNLLASGLTDAGVYNEELALGLLDMEKITFENGEARGLSEEIERIKNEYAFLFRKEGPQFSSGSTSGNEVDISSLNYLERLRLFKENPDLYKLQMNK